MTPFRRFLKDGVCADSKEKGIKKKCSHFVIIGKEMFKRNYTRPLLRCISAK